MLNVTNFSSSIVFCLLLFVQSSWCRTISSPVHTGCSFSSSNFSLNWSYDELSNDIVFKLVARSHFDNFYTAVAFGDDEPVDVISVYVRAGQIGLIDGHLSDDDVIESDEKTNVQALQFDLENGVLMAQFARPIESIDSNDVDLSACFQLFLPVETREIITDAPLELGESLKKLRICDLATKCATKTQNDIVKRQEGSVCSTASASSDDVDVVDDNNKSDNRIDWRVNDERVEFVIKQNVKNGRWWTAIGVGPSMNDLTMIVAFVENGRLKKQGIYRTEGKMVPVLVDDEFGLSKEMSIVDNKITEIHLSIDKTFLTSKFDDQGCAQLQISIQGGNYRPNFEIVKHKSTPKPFLVCNLENCSSSALKSTTSSFSNSNNSENNPTTSTNPVLADANNDFQLDESSSGIEPIIELTTTTDVEGSGSAAADAESLISGSADVVPAVNNNGSSVGATLLIDDNPLTGNSIADEATTKPPQDVENSTQILLNNADAAQRGCGPDHEDLKICESYFAEYLGKVTEWSNRHQMKVGAHMWKACTLLSQVQHVTTMCCSIFRNTCAAHLNL